VSGIQFFQTRMGQQFFDVTLPKIADELARLNKTLEPIAAAVQALASRAPTEHASAGAVEACLKPVLIQLAGAHLPVDAVEPQAGLGLHETIASALGIALRAACQTGVAETLRALRADPRDDAATTR
jgi:hypothetical protein